MSVADRSDYYDDPLYRTRIANELGKVSLQALLLLRASPNELHYTIFWPLITEEQSDVDKIINCTYDENGVLLGFSPFFLIQRTSLSNKWNEMEYFFCYRSRHCYL